MCDFVLYALVFVHVVCGGGSSGGDGSGACVESFVLALAGYGVLSTGCLDGRFCGYGTKQPLTPGMSGMSLASSPF